MHEAAFIRFHRANPKVYEMIKQFALQAVAAGHRRFGIAPVVERVRWQVNIENRSKAKFKIPNAYRAYYARMFIHEFPRQRNLFRLGKSAADTMNFAGV